MITHANLKRLICSAIPTLWLILTFANTNTAYASSVFRSRGDRVEFGIRTGGYGISNSTIYSYYTSKTTPAFGGYVGLRLYRFLWSQIRYEHYKAPLKARLGLYDDAVKFGSLEVTQLEFVPVALELNLGRKWTGMLYPFSYINISTTTDVDPGVYYYPGFGEYLYGVLDVNLDESGGFGLFGCSFAYHLTRNFSLGFETWIVRGSVPDLSLRVYELGLYEGHKLRGLMIVFPIFVHISTHF